LDEWPRVKFGLVDVIVVRERLESFICNFNCGQKSTADSLLKTESDLVEVLVVWT
jgi:hypothetical protein